MPNKFTETKNRSSEGRSAAATGYLNGLSENIARCNTSDVEYIILVC